MDPIVFVFVATAAVLHVAWNVLLKTAGDPLRAAAVGMATAAAVLCPVALGAWLCDRAAGDPVLDPRVCRSPRAPSRPLYFAFLAAAYRRGDLSLVYPLARGTAPLIAVAIGVFVLDETLAPTGSLGVVCLLDRDPRPPAAVAVPAGGRSASTGGAAGFAMLTGVTIAAYSAVDSVGVQGTAVWIYAALIWAWMTTFLWGYVWVYRWRDDRPPRRVDRRRHDRHRSARGRGPSPRSRGVLAAPGGHRRPAHARGLLPDPRGLFGRTADRRRAPA